MPAYRDRRRTVRPRERTYALAAAVAIQAALGLALLLGLRVVVSRPADVPQQLIDIVLPRPAPPPEPVRPMAAPRKAAHPSESAPKAEPKPLGGAPGPRPAHAPPSVAAAVPILPTVARSGGGAGSGPALGSGAGGGTGGNGYGEDGGGTDLEHIAGEIRPSDYPRALGRAGVGGRVSVTFTVQVDGRVSGCRVTRSSGVAELDALTCRLIEQRFRFRPSTDRSGRPVADEVDWDQDWIAPRGG